jgi:hypothetical protein
MSRVYALLTVVMMLLALPAVAFGGEDEAPGPPPASPPGPWDAPTDTDVPYQPSGTKNCGMEGISRVGPGKLLGVFAKRVGCYSGQRLVHTYQSCLERRGDGCYKTIDRRCVQIEFLGRCRTYDTFYWRRIKGFRCVERRLYEIGDLYSANVDCAKGGNKRRLRIDHSYTLFMSPSVAVGTESDLRAAWGNPLLSEIQMTKSIVLHACRLGDPIRESASPIRIDGGGHTLRQGCFEKRLLRQDGTGFVEVSNLTMTRGGSDGPGAALVSRGEIAIVDCHVQENLSEEPGGGIMSERRVTVIRSVITGNLANDDGGGVYARRGGIQVYDSVISSNLVDGSGGALGSTGDILVVRSHIDGNTTDGDGGALYADEDGDITVIDSTVNGSTADGPGGAIFTLDGDVTVIGSTLNGNRADDRGGAISGEATVTVVNSTIARNAAVAHVGGGIWARGNLFVANSTISDNYAEGQGGGILGARIVGLVNTTVTENIAPVGANVGAGERLDAFGSIIGPANTDPFGGQVQPTSVNCLVASARSYGYNFVSDGSCGLAGPGDAIGNLPKLGPLAQNGGFGETHMPSPGSPVLDRIPVAACRFVPFAEGDREGEMHLAGLVDYPAVAIGRDQRGVARPQGGACDAGAVEAGG